MLVSRLLGVRNGHRRSPQGCSDGHSDMIADLPKAMSVIGASTALVRNSCTSGAQRVGSPPRIDSRGSQ